MIAPYSISRSHPFHPKVFQEVPISSNSISRSHPFHPKVFQEVTHFIARYFKKSPISSHCISRSHPFDRTVFQEVTHFIPQYFKKSHIASDGISRSNLISSHAAVNQIVRAQSNDSMYLLIKYELRNRTSGNGTFTPYLYSRQRSTPLYTLSYYGKHFTSHLNVYEYTVCTVYTVHKVQMHYTVQYTLQLLIFFRKNKIVMAI